MHYQQHVIVLTCIIMIIRQCRPLVSLSFITFSQSEFFSIESSNIANAYKQINQAHVPSTNFLWTIAPLSVLLFPAPDSFRSKSFLIYGTVLEFFRSYLFSLSYDNLSIKAALPRVNSIFEIFFSISTVVYCAYLYTKVDDRQIHHKITFYVYASILMGGFFNNYILNQATNSKRSYFEMDSNHIAVPVIVFMIFLLIPKDDKEKDIKKDLAAADRFLKETYYEEEVIFQRDPFWRILWYDFKDIFSLKDVQKWSMCWWLSDTLQNGVAQDFMNFILMSVPVDHTLEATRWFNEMNSLELLLSAVVIAIISQCNIMWKNYIDWIVCYGPFYYVMWGLVRETDPLLVTSFLYIISGIITRVTFVISLSQLAKYVPSSKHLLVFCFNSMFGLALKIAFQISYEKFYYTDAIFRVLLVIMVAAIGKKMFTSLTKFKPRNMEDY
ncbi:uncharacterized protein LOC135842620 [Planococcus citri]|uniref:uncharacterized protein LOC135842620 n=1 Tax=Planococcus citri TaxID=170843 RepID=UPI0031F92B76